VSCYGCTDPSQRIGAELRGRFRQVLMPRSASVGIERVLAFALILAERARLLKQPVDQPGALRQSMPRQALGAVLPVFRP
jgi:hypothetical protein